MPFKANADRCHHIPQQKYKVTNWSAYNASLCQHGSLTVWFSKEEIAVWEAKPRITHDSTRRFLSLEPPDILLI